MFPVTITDIILFAGYAILFLAETIANNKNIRSSRDVLLGTGNLSLYNIKGFVCGFFLLLLSAAWMTVREDFSLLALPLNENSWVYCLVAVLIIFLSLINATKTQISDRSHLQHFSSNSLLAYVLTRTLFLIGYELFFRGVLLYTLADEFGIVKSIIANGVLYALIHIHSDRKEIIGSIPFGLLLCIATFFNHTIWLAVIIHLSLALTHEITFMLMANKYSSPKIAKS